MALTAVGVMYAIFLALGWLAARKVKAGSAEDLIVDEDMVVTISHAGYIKRTHPSAYRAQKRGGKGKIGMEAREEDWVTQLKERYPKQELPRNLVVEAGIS